MPSSILQSIIRTFVPMLVSGAIALAARANIDLGPATDLLTMLLGLAVTTLYYALVRLLETRVKPKFGWLIGAPGAPTYQAPAKDDATSPTGYSSTPDGPAPADTPVEVTPVDAPPLEAPAPEGFYDAKHD